MTFDYAMPLNLNSNNKAFTFPAMIDLPQTGEVDGVEVIAQAFQNANMNLLFKKSDAGLATEKPNFAGDIITLSESTMNYRMICIEIARAGSKRHKVLYFNPNNGMYPCEYWDIESALGSMKGTFFSGIIFNNGTTLNLGYDGTATYWKEIQNPFWDGTTKAVVIDSTSSMVVRRVWGIKKKARN